MEKAEVEVEEEAEEEEDLLVTLEILKLQKILIKIKINKRILLEYA